MNLRSDQIAKPVLDVNDREQIMIPREVEVSQ
jgi:hypothetical protein